MTDLKKSVLIILGVVLLVGAVLLGWRYRHLTNAANNFSSEKVNVKKEKGLISNKFALPEGFPKEIPVEVEHLTDSSTLTYPDRGITLYSVAYVSTKSAEELSSLYKNFFSQGFYVINTDTFGKEKNGSIVLEGTAGMTTTSIMITRRNDSTSLVQASYVVKN